MRALRTAARRATMATAVAVALWSTAASPQESDPTAAETREEIEMSPISGPQDRPRRHFRLRFPAKLTPSAAAEYYDIIRGAMLEGYGRSGLDAAQNYQSWRRYNRAPYPSAAHGNHYLNNYANDTAAAYGAFDEAGELPVGSVIAKDSFAVTETGGILLGSLAIMEKMPAGFNYVSGDWRYTLVQPDGTVLGRTKGEGAERVQYCITCHLARERQDHLYFIPERYRISPSD